MRSTYKTSGKKIRILIAQFGIIVILTGALTSILNSPTELKSIKLASSLNGSSSLTSIYLGYADTYGGNTDTPSVWPSNTTSPVNVLGSSVYANSNDILSGTLDTGAVMIINNSNENETISNLSVTLGSTTYPTNGGSWASQTISPGEGLMADQTASTTNFDSTSANTSCTVVNSTIPTITYTLTLGTTSYNESSYDTGLVLSDSGLNRTLSSCVADKSENWTPIGFSATTPLVGGSPSSVELAGLCSAPETLCSGPSQSIYNSVNTGFGNVSLGYSGFSAPSMVQNLELKLIYDSSVAQYQGLSGSYPGLFGFGWNFSLDYGLALKNSPYSASTTSSPGTQAIAVGPGGAETGFTATSTGGQCVAPQTLTTEGNVPDSNPSDPLATFCAYPRVNDWLSYYPTYAAYLLGSNGGLDNTSYGYTGQLAYFGNQNDANYVNVSYDVSPGSQDCPTTTLYWATDES